MCDCAAKLRQQLDGLDKRYARRYLVFGANAYTADLDEFRNAAYERNRCKDAESEQIVEETPVIKRSRQKVTKPTEPSDLWD